MANNDWLSRPTLLPVASMNVAAARHELGVSVCCIDRKVIKAAWRRRCLKEHPDKNVGDPDATRRLSAEIKN